MALPALHTPLHPAKVDEIPVFERRRVPERLSRHQSHRRRSLNFPIVVFAGAVALAWFLERPAALPPHPVPYIAPPPQAMHLPELAPPSANTMSHTIKAGDTLSAVLTSHGFDGSLALPLLQAMKSLPDAPATLHRGKQLYLTASGNGELESIRVSLPSGKEALLDRTESSRKENNFSARFLETPRYDLDRVATGTISTSFSAAAQKAGVSYDVIDDLVDLFSDRIEFSKDFRGGDRFTLIYRDSQTMDGKSLGSPKILAAAIMVDGSLFTATRYVGADGKEHFFDENGRILGNSFLRYPVQFSRISSSFSESRFHPVLGRNRPHNGVDFAAPTGTPVRSVGEGRVVFAGYKGPNGNMVLIRHNDRYSTAYLHLSKISPGISRGKLVEKGQKIGAVGMTGLATGPHLHFSLYDHNRYVNPLKVKLNFSDLAPKPSPELTRYLRLALLTLLHYQEAPLA